MKSWGCSREYIKSVIGEFTCKNWPLLTGHGSTGDTSKIVLKCTYFSDFYANGCASQICLGK